MIPSIFSMGILSVSWLIYLFSFHHFYQENYFYIDKKQTIMIQILTFLANDWNQSIMYFLTALVLITLSLALLVFFYVKRKEQRHKGRFIFFLLFTLGCLIKLLITIYSLIFIGIFIVSVSSVYIIYVWLRIKSTYEVEEVIALKGPFKTEQEAQVEADKFLKNYGKQNHYGLISDIYLEEDNYYYAEIYVESENKFEG